MRRRMPFLSTLNPCSFHPRWKRNLVGWWVPLNWRKAHPAKRSSISYQATATLSYAPSKSSLVAGDHKQTPGGLRKSEEARVFRRKLMRRPIALRRHNIPPTACAGRHSPSVCQRCTWTPDDRGESAPSRKHQTTTRSIHWERAVFQELCKETIGSCWEAGITPCCCAGIALRPVLV